MPQRPIISQFINIKPFIERNLISSEQYNAIEDNVVQEMIRSSLPELNTVLFTLTNNTFSMIRNSPESVEPYERMSQLTNMLDRDITFTLATHLINITHNMIQQSIIFIIGRMRLLIHHSDNRAAKLLAHIAKAL